MNQLLLGLVEVLQLFPSPDKFVVSDLNHRNFWPDLHSDLYSIFLKVEEYGGMSIQNIEGQ